MNHNDWSALKIFLVAILVAVVLNALIIHLKKTGYLEGFNNMVGGSCNSCNNNLY